MSIRGRLHCVNTNIKHDTHYQHRKIFSYFTLIFLDRRNIITGHSSLNYSINECFSFQDIHGQSTLTETQDFILEILSYIGCGLSILGLIATIFAYASQR